MSINPRPDDLPPLPDTNSTMTLTASLFASASPSLHDQYPSNPPPALTVVLSIACGIVATCILFTVRMYTIQPSSFHPLIQQLSPEKNTHCNRPSYYSYAIALASRHSAKDSSTRAASPLHQNQNPAQMSTFPFQLRTIDPEVRRTPKTVRSRDTFPSYTAVLPPSNPRQRRAQARILVVVAAADHLNAFLPSRIPMPSILARPAWTRWHLFPPTSSDSPPFCILDFCEMR